MSAETKWTPGPWVVDTRQRRYPSWNGAAVTAANCKICTLSVKADRPLPQKESDAYLIAAAPALYEALQKARNCLAANMRYAAADQCDFALSKARGETTAEDV